MRFEGATMFRSPGPDRIVDDLVGELHGFDVLESPQIDPHRTAVQIEVLRRARVGRARGRVVLGRTCEIPACHRQATTRSGEIATCTLWAAGALDRFLRSIERSGS